ncbi:MAG: hypothetical protein K2O69_07290 [Odoribacter sp.]|nr:hypothetical protein [Odoribacter sp.]
MKFNLNQGKTILLSLLALCASCGDADLFDTDKWSDQIEGWEPGVKAKIAQGTFTLWDLVNQGDDDVIVKEGNDLVIQYTKEDIYKIRVEDVFDIVDPDIKLSQYYHFPDELGLSSGSVVLPEDFIVRNLRIEPQSIKIPAGCELKKMTASASLELPKFPFNYEINLKFPNILDVNGDTLQIERSVASGEVCKVGLNDMELFFPEKEEVELWLVQWKIPAGSTLSNEYLELAFNLTNLRFKQVEGKIAVREPLEIYPGSFDMNVDFLNEVGGTFRFTKPEINVVLHNKGMGVPLNVVPVFEATNEGQNFALELKDDQRLYTEGNTSNEFVNDTLGLNAGNSNIVDFISLPPRGEISYKGMVQINPDGTDNNIVYSDAEVSLDAYVRIPFALSAENLSYKDTLTDIDIDAKYAEKIQEGVIEILTDKNELGLKLQVSALILVDEAGNELTTITAVEGKEWLEEGTSIEFKINHEQAVKLGQTDQILLEVVASTGEENGVPKEVVIEADAQLNFSLMLTVKTKIENLNDF